jgi:hypothetical protein
VPAGIHFRGQVNDPAGGKIGGVWDCEDGHIATVVSSGIPVSALSGGFDGRLFW